MLYIEAKNTIKLTRGDTAYLSIPLFMEVINDDGSVAEEKTPYEMQPSDTLTLTVKRTAEEAHICFQKVSVGTNSFKILPADTADCEFGRYKYDIQLQLANGDVFTVVEPACFTIMPEVT